MYNIHKRRETKIILLNCSIQYVKEKGVEIKRKNKTKQERCNLKKKLLKADGMPPNTSMGSVPSYLQAVSSLSLVPFYLLYYAVQCKIRLEQARPRLN